MKVMLVTETMHDATAWYRGYYPLRSMDLELVIENEVREDMDIDCIFMQRPQTDEHVAILNQAKKLNIPVWVDWDDYVLGVPKYNSCHTYYDRAEIRENILFCLRSADVLTTATPWLKEIWSEYNKNVHVIPNAINDIDLPYVPEREPNNNKTIVWRGSRTHREDVILFQKEIESLITDPEKQDWNWVFMGMTFQFLFKHFDGSRVRFIGDLKIREYHQVLCDLKPTILMVPLVESDFNRCKSNIAWIEATYAGAVALGPAWDEWIQPGLFNYGGAQGFESALREVMNLSTIERTRKHLDSIKRIEDRLLLSETNEMRGNIIAELCRLPINRACGRS